MLSNANKVSLRNFFALAFAASRKTDRPAGRKTDKTDKVVRPIRSGLVSDRFGKFRNN